MSQIYKPKTILTMNWIKHKNYEMIIIFSKIKIPSLEKTLCKVFAILIWKISFSQKLHPVYKAIEITRKKGSILSPLSSLLNSNSEQNLLFYFV